MKVDVGTILLAHFRTKGDCKIYIQSIKDKTNITIQGSRGEWYIVRKGI